MDFTDWSRGFDREFLCLTPVEALGEAMQLSSEISGVFRKKIFTRVLAPLPEPIPPVLVG